MIPRGRGEHQARSATVNQILEAKYGFVMPGVAEKLASRKPWERRASATTPSATPTGWSAGDSARAPRGLSPGWSSAHA
jgi:hypothetical protein